MSNIANAKSTTSNAKDIGRVLVVDDHEPARESMACVPASVGPPGGLLLQRDRSARPG